MVAKAERGQLAAGLRREKPGKSLSTVAEAPMDLTADAAKDSEVAQAPELAQGADRPGSEPQQVVKPEDPKPAEPQAEPQEPTFEPEPEPELVRKVEIQPAQQDAALHHPTELQVVRIAAPVHARKKKPDQIQLSVKLKGELLERFEKARYETGLAGQEIGVEAIEIWLAHNGF